MRTILKLCYYHTHKLYFSTHSHEPQCHNTGSTISFGGVKIHFLVAVLSGWGERHMSSWRLPVTWRCWVWRKLGCPQLHSPHPEFSSWRRTGGERNASRIYEKSVCERCKLNLGEVSAWEKYKQNLGGKYVREMQQNLGEVSMWKKCKQNLG